MFISQELISTNVLQQKEFVSLIFCVPLNESHHMLAQQYMVKSHYFYAFYTVFKWKSIGTPVLLTFNFWRYNEFAVEILNPCY